MRLFCEKIGRSDLKGAPMESFVRSGEMLKQFSGIPLLTDREVKSSKVMTSCRKGTTETDEYGVAMDIAKVYIVT